MYSSFFPQTQYLGVFHFYLNKKKKVFFILKVLPVSRRHKVFLFIFYCISLSSSTHDHNLSPSFPLHLLQNGTTGFVNRCFHLLFRSRFFFFLSLAKTYCCQTLPLHYVFFSNRDKQPPKPMVFNNLYFSDNRNVSIQPDSHNSKTQIVRYITITIHNSFGLQF